MDWREKREQETEQMLALERECNKLMEGRINRLNERNAKLVAALKKISNSCCASAVVMAYARAAITENEA